MSQTVLSNLYLVILTLSYIFSIFWLYKIIREENLLNIFKDLILFLGLILIVLIYPFWMLMIIFLSVIVVRNITFEDNTRSNESQRVREV